MEVKINREIRNYTESMFFGLSLRQFIFSVLACGVAVGLYFLLRPYVGTETVSWVCILGAAPCGTWLCEVQRYDRRKSNLCVDKIGVFDAEEAGVSLHQCVLRTDEAKH